MEQRASAPIVTSDCGDMAEDAGVPYYGSYMSLMTHGGVRYEGVLTSVDMANSTLRLSNGEWVDLFYQLLKETGEMRGTFWLCISVVDIS